MSYGFPHPLSLHSLSLSQRGGRRWAAARPATAGATGAVGGEEVGAAAGGVLVGVGVAVVAMAEVGMMKTAAAAMLEAEVGRFRRRRSSSRRRLATAMARTTTAGGMNLSSH